MKDSRAYAVREHVRQAEQLVTLQARSTDEDQRMWLRLAALLWVCRDLADDVFERCIERQKEAPGRQPRGH